jgi:hypothetical protein
MQDTNYKLRAWMGANKVSGTEMARRIDMPYDTFKNKMAGTSQWKLSEVVTLIEVTKLPFEELF